MKRFFCLCLTVILLAGMLPMIGSAAPEAAAKSALLMDVATGTVLYEQNPHEKLPPASVTKVMTMLLIMEAISDGRLKWEDTVTASETAAAKGGSQIYLKEGETMTVKDMLKSIAVSSANDCACAMAEHLCGSEEAFVEKMNQRAKELGMEDTHFVNCTGLDDGPEGKAHLTSAHDIALMSRQLLKYHPQITEFTTIWMDTVRSGQFGLSNTNKLVRFYNGATGLKTGFTAAAGYCLSASAQREELHLVAVVMGSETSKDRFNACKALLDFGFANYALVQPEINALSVPVKLGQEKTVNAVPGQDHQLLIEKAQKASVSVTTELCDSVTAPVSKGQRLGTMTVRSGEQILAQIPLVAQNAVPKRTFGELFLDMLKGLCMAK
jgi:D-alanyl-D-alanine carboxypeptidase (penicillin-binding protein 5/6)